MKAIVWTKYGSPDVLRLQEVERPEIKEDQILVKVHAASISPVDWRFRAGEFRARMFSGLIKPKLKILGFDLAGEVEEVGDKITKFKKGDQVYGGAALSSGGANAEYVALSENDVVIKPANMTCEEAAAVPVSATTALQALRDIGKIRHGQRALINGASGGVGTFAVQLAGYFGAQVTGVCSTGNLELVKSLGAEEVIDYTRDDFTKMDREYDIIFDAVGKKTFSECKNSLTRFGIFISTELSFQLLLQMIWTSKMSSKKAISMLSKESPDDLNFLKGLIEAGQLKAVIDRCYSLDQTAEAHRYAELGHAKGKVVIIV